MAENAQAVRAPASRKATERGALCVQRAPVDAVSGRPGQPDYAAMLNGRPAVATHHETAAHLAGRAAPGPMPVQRAATPNRTGLPDRLKSGVEALSGVSLDEVKVHYNSARPAELDALAYAQGTDIHLAPRQEQHLPHEAWHVVQQAQGRVRATAQMKGASLSDDPPLEREADAMGARALGAISEGPTQADTRPLSAGSAPVQRKKFDFEGHELDSDDLVGFARWCGTMAHVNRQRLQDLIPFLHRNAPGIDQKNLLRMFAFTKDALGTPLPAEVHTIGMEYQNILDGLNALVSTGEEIGRLDTLRKTIRAAALIDANAALIAEYGPQARAKIGQLVGEVPETGFVGESMETIRNRARVLVFAWADAVGDAGRLALFRTGFANDPCLAGRLNGITEFRAVQTGIDPAALSDAPYDTTLSNEIMALLYEKESDFLHGEDYDRGAFRQFLAAEHPAKVAHSKFEGSYTAAWQGYSPG